jgi:hypothetical protein
VTTSALVVAVVAASFLIAAITLVLMIARARRGAIVPTPADRRSPPPVVEIDGSGDENRWRVDVPSDAASILLDIISFRSVGTEDWSAEPLIEPIAIPPGGSATVPASIDDPHGHYDVVIGWTDLAAGGPTQLSRALTVGAAVPAGGALYPGTDRTDDLGEADTEPPTPTSPRARVIVPAGLVVLAAVAGTAAWLSTGDDMSPAPDDQVGAAPSSSPPNRPDTTSAATSSNSESDEADVAATTGTSAPVVSSAISTSVAPASTPAPTTTSSTTSVPTGPRIELSGRVEDCKHGADCVIVGFELIEFGAPQSQYTCEFADGSRFTFNFGGPGVTEACSASGPSPSITVEVAGVRSATVTRASFPVDGD